MSTAPAFRHAAPPDIDAIVELMERYYREDGYPFDAGGSRRAVATLIAQEALGRLWVLQDAEGVAGYLAVTLGYSLEYQGRDAFIDELYLAERARGQGMGRRALELAEAYAGAVGVSALHLEVEQHRTRARALYAARGYAGNDRRLLTKRLSRPAS